MHFYIYPKNWDAEDVVVNLQKIQSNFSFSFIDDGDEKNSLEMRAEEIRKNKESLVLICSKYRYFDLAKRLEDKRIENYVNGLKFCAKRINDYYLEFLKNRYQTQYSVGLLVTQLPHSDHIASIIEELQKRNIPIVFFVTSAETYKKYQIKFKESSVIIARCDLMAEISFVTLIHAMTHYVKIHSNVISILNPQGLLDPIQNYFYFSREEADCLVGSRVGFDYIFCHTAKMYKFYKERLGNLIHSSKLVPVGYPSLDAYIQSYENVDKIKEETSSRQTVIVAFTVIKIEQGKDICGLDIATLKEIISKLLKEYQVVFRPHPEAEKKVFMLEIVEHFKEHEHFIYDVAPRLSNQIMQKALTIIGNQTSLLQTFPFATLKPAIIFIKDKEIFNRLCIDKSYLVDDIAHILVHNVEDMMEALCNIQKNLSLSLYQQIKKQRERERFFILESQVRLLLIFLKVSYIKRKKMMKAFKVF